MDDRVKELVTDLQQGYLTRRGFLAKASALGLSTAAALRMLGGATAEAQAPAVQPKRWQKGKGWGWVWGQGDQVGNLNELSPELTRKALSLAKTGRVYDLGLNYDRRSFKWPGHSPGEILTFRNQQGTFAQRDLDFLSAIRETRSRPASRAVPSSSPTTWPRSSTATATSPSGRVRTPSTTTASRPPRCWATGV